MPRPKLGKSIELAVDFAAAMLEKAESRVKALERETDSGCVLRAAAILDDALERLIRAKILESMSNAADEHPVEIPIQILGDRGLLGSLWSKHEAAYCFGLIGSETRNAISKIRDLRNLFAHSEEIHELTKRNVSDIKSACPQLKSLGSEYVWNNSSGRMSRHRIEFMRIALVLWALSCYSASAIKLGKKYRRF